MKIYLDYNASTPIADEVIEAMKPFFQQHYGNPSTNHFAAAEAKRSIEDTRMKVASLIGAKANEIIFTSGGTESNNHVVKGVVEACKHQGRHVIASSIEHPAILEPLRYLESKNEITVTYLPVNSKGRVSVKDVKKAIRPDTILITIMHANNEVGSIQPIAEIGEIAKEEKVLFHTDAAQSIGKVEVDVEEMHVDFLSIAGHKLYAPKGVGALYIRNGIQIGPYMHGAGHENGMRAGTENVLFITALGEACRLAEEKVSNMNKVKQMRDDFKNELKEAFGELVVINGDIDHCLPNTLNISFKGKVGQDILDLIPEVAASTGSACHSGEVVLSPVLEAMGVSKEVGMGTIRFSLGRETTIAEMNQVIHLLKERLL